MAIIEVITKLLPWYSKCLLTPENPILNSKPIVKTAKFKTLFLKYFKTRQLETWGKCKTTILVSFHVYDVSLRSS